MLIRLKRVDRKEDKSIMFDFPYDESEVFNVYNQLELETSTAPNCYIDGVVYDSDMNEILKGKECNIDELTFYLKGWIVSIQRKEKCFLLHPLQKIPKQ